MKQGTSLVELAERMNFSFQELTKYVDAIDYGMSEFSKGNFTCECPMDFLGDFAHIQKNQSNIFRLKMNNTLLELNTASVQVSAGLARWLMALRPWLKVQQSRQAVLRNYLQRLQIYLIRFLRPQNIQKKLMC